MQFPLVMLDFRSPFSDGETMPKMKSCQNVFVEGCTFIKEKVKFES